MKDWSITGIIIAIIMIGFGIIYPVPQKIYMLTTAIKHINMIGRKTKERSTLEAMHIITR